MHRSWNETGVYRDSVTEEEDDEQGFMEVSRSRRSLFKRAKKSDAAGASSPRMVGRNPRTMPLPSPRRRRYFFCALWTVIWGFIHEIMSFPTQILSESFD